MSYMYVYVCLSLKFMSVKYILILLDNITILRLVIVLLAYIRTLQRRTLTRPILLCLLLGHTTLTHVHVCFYQSSHDQYIHAQNLLALFTDIQRSLGDLPSLLPRLLILQASADIHGSYNGMMNCIFSAKRSSILVDACVFSAKDSTFLQQAAFLTGKRRDYYY